MTSTRCPTCGGCEWVCTGCGKGRNRFSKSKSETYSAIHHSCPRRPGGVKRCPSHEKSTTKCDVCSFTVEDSFPAKWRQTERGHTCPGCLTKMSVAVDSVGSLEFDRVRLITFDNLRRALERLDPASLTLEQRRRMLLAMTDFQGREALVTTLNVLDQCVVEGCTAQADDSIATRKGYCRAHWAVERIVEPNIRPQAFLPPLDKPR